MGVSSFFSLAVLRKDLSSGGNGGESLSFLFFFDFSSASLFLFKSRGNLVSRDIWFMGAITLMYITLQAAEKILHYIYKNIKLLKNIAKDNFSYFSYRHKLISSLIKLCFNFSSSFPTIWDILASVRSKSKATSLMVMSSK